MVINVLNGIVSSPLFCFDFKIILKNYDLIVDDIYDEASGSIRALGLDTECLGGGRIEHFPDKKFLKVYGYSQVFVSFW